MNKKERREFLALAKRNGATVISGAKHFKVYAADGRYLLSLAHGNGNGSSGSHKGERAYQVAQRERWRR